MSDVTQVLAAIDAGDLQAAGQLLPLVYDELRQLASQQLVQEKPGQTLQPTALVHEAYLRLVPNSAPNAQDPRVNFENRRYFFAAAGEAMRRILVENARRKQAVRHGGKVQREHLDLDQIPQKQHEELLAVHEALDHLADHDSLKAELVKLRYFAGFTNDEAAELLGITSKNAEKQWVYARAWLKHRLTSNQ